MDERMNWLVQAALYWLEQQEPEIQTAQAVWMKLARQALFDAEERDAPLTNEDYQTIYGWGGQA